MVEFKGGKDEAAKMLSGLDAESAERILEDIAKKDPAMAKYLRDNMVVFEDLNYLTTEMIRDLLGQVRIDESKVVGHIGFSGYKMIKFRINGANDHYLVNVH